MNKVELEINNKKRVFWLGVGFMGNLIDDLNISFLEIDKRLAENPFKIVPLMFYHSLAYGYEREGKEPDFTKHDVIDWIDNDGGFENPVVISYLDAFKQSKEKGVPGEEDKKKVKKLKSTGTEM